MGAVLLIFFVGYVIWSLYQHDNLLEHFKEKVAKAESLRSGLTYTPEQVLPFGGGKFTGGIPRAPLPFNVGIFVVNGRLYFLSEKNIRFSIDKADISDFGILGVNVPYIMNVNAAALIANEMTRREAGSNFYIVYSEDGENFESFRIDGMKTSNQLFAYLSQ